MKYGPSAGTDRGALREWIWNRLYKVWQRFWRRFFRMTLIPARDLDDEGKCNWSIEVLAVSPHYSVRLELEDGEPDEYQLEEIKNTVELEGMRIIVWCEHCDQHHISDKVLVQCAFCGSKSLVHTEVFCSEYYEDV